MTGHKKQIFIRILVLAIFFATALIIFGVWLYSGKLNVQKITIFNKMPFPIALINNKPLKMSGYTARWETYQKLYEQGISAQSPNQAKETIFNQMIMDEKVAQICEKYNITLSQKEIEEEYSEQSLISGNDFENLLISYGLNTHSYQQFVIKPQLLLIKLQTWFNSQEQLNNSQYKLAKNLLEQVNSGQDMAVLAEQFSQDEIGKDIGGDMGFLDPVTLLSEMREPVYALTVNEIKIIPDRYGINVLRLEEKQGNLFLLRQIFLQAEDFKQWLEQETKNFRINKLVNF